MASGYPFAMLARSLAQPHVAHLQQEDGVAAGEPGGAPKRTRAPRHREDPPSVWRRIREAARPRSAGSAAVTNTTPGLGAGPVPGVAPLAAAVGSGSDPLPVTTLHSPVDDGSSRGTTLPVALRGKASRNTTARGTENFARR